MLALVGAAAVQLAVTYPPTHPITGADAPKRRSLGGPQRCCYPTPHTPQPPNLARRGRCRSRGRRAAGTRPPRPAPRSATRPSAHGGRPMAGPPIIGQPSRHGSAFVGGACQRLGEPGAGGARRRIRRLIADEAAAPSAMTRRRLRMRARLRVRAGSARRHRQAYLPNIADSEVLHSAPQNPRYFW
jgi:hypothetical protein